MSEQQVHAHGPNGDAVHGEHGDFTLGPSKDDAGRAVLDARSAQQYWKITSLSSRIEAIERAARQMLVRRNEITQLAHDEMGKVAAEALFNEALGSLDQVKGWARVVEDATRRRQVTLNQLSFPKKRAHIDFVPRGVVGVIAPWNFPVAGLYRAVFPALMTGNGVVLKPSEYTPRCAAWFIERLADQLPEGLVRIVEGDGRVGAALIHAGIDACVFTGSPRTGRKVALQCAERGIPASVEMGGKDAAIVLGDCDLPRTVAAITHWALSNAGQACGAIEVAYVDDHVADAFLTKMARAWVELTDESVGPLANQRQFDVVAAHVDDAVAKGARLVCGGRRLARGLWYPPTLLDRCDERMAVVTDETFGPVLAVVRVAGAAEAVSAVNRSRYGLGASIWTRDQARAERLAERLDVGIVNINNHAFSGAIPSLPWSGTRETGFGTANSSYALPTFVRTRVTTSDASGGPDVYWMPYDKALQSLGEILAQAQLAKISRVWELPLLIRRRVKAIRALFW